jgi:hypothetical protein
LNIEHQLTGTIRIQHGAVLVVVAGMIMGSMIVACVIVAFMGVLQWSLDRLRGGVVFEGIGRTQDFAFQARAARRSNYPSWPPMQAANLGCHIVQRIQPALSCACRPELPITGLEPDANRRFPMQLPA